MARTLPYLKMTAYMSRFGDNYLTNPVYNLQILMQSKLSTCTGKPIRR